MENKSFVPGGRKRMELLAQHPVTSRIGDSEEGLQSWRREQVRDWLAIHGEKAAEIMLEVWEAMDGEAWDNGTLYRVSQAFRDAGLQLVEPTKEE